jgi:glutamate dehydrogenase/leucine dehydrogenase
MALDVPFRSDVRSATRAASMAVMAGRMRRVAVWGAGNMGSTAARSVVALPGLRVIVVGNLLII